jgi:hypothetical protein
VRITSTLTTIVSLVLAGCCITNGWHECDSSSHVGGCRGNHYEYCWRTSNPWSGEYEELIEGDCAADEVCFEPSPGLPGCVLAPATPCDEEVPFGRCDGNVPALCAPPNSWITDPYRIHGAACTNGWSCRLQDGYASCVPP